MAALVRLHNRCAFDDDTKGRCDNCGHSFNQSSHLRDLRLRDQVVRGLFDAGMQRRVLMEEYDQQLTRHRTLQICQAYEASRVTEQALNQDNPPQLLAARHTPSSYKRNKSTHTPPPAQCQYCGDGHHPRNQCKARNHTCRNCGKQGHLASGCR